MRTISGRFNDNWFLRDCQIIAIDEIFTNFLWLINNTLHCESIENFWVHVIFIIELFIELIKIYKTKKKGYIWESNKS